MPSAPDVLTRRPSHFSPSHLLLNLSRLHHECRHARSQGHQRVVKDLSPSTNNLPWACCRRTRRAYWHFLVHLLCLWWHPGMRFHPLLNRISDDYNILPGCSYHSKWRQQRQHQRKHDGSFKITRPALIYFALFWFFACCQCLGLLPHQWRPVQPCGRCKHSVSPVNSS